MCPGDGGSCHGYREVLTIGKEGGRAGGRVSVVCKRTSLAGGGEGEREGGVCLIVGRRKTMCVYV